MMHFNYGYDQELACKEFLAFVTDKTIFKSGAILSMVKQYRLDLQNAREADRAKKAAKKAARAAASSSAI